MKTTEKFYTVFAKNKKMLEINIPPASLLYLHPNH